VRAGFNGTAGDRGRRGKRGRLGEPGQKGDKGEQGVEGPPGQLIHADTGRPFTFYLPLLFYHNFSSLPSFLIFCLLFCQTKSR